jgi:hypothetical protein
MPGQRQPRVVEPRDVRGNATGRGERIPLLAASGSSKQEKTGPWVNSSLSPLGKVWVWCCCSVVPCLLLAGLLGVIVHHMHARMAASFQHPEIGNSVSASVSVPPLTTEAPLQALTSRPLEPETTSKLRHHRHKHKTDHAVEPLKTPLLRSSHDAAPLKLSARCTLPLPLNMVCSGIIKAAFSTEEARIKAELFKHLPSWVQGVALSYDGEALVAEPSVRLTTAEERTLFGPDPPMRLRCTFESLMRSAKVLDATRILSEYSGGICAATAGTAECSVPGSSGASQCDPFGDSLIPDP